MSGINIFIKNYLIFIFILYQIIIKYLLRKITYSLFLYKYTCI